MSLLQMSISGALMILAIIVIRTVALHKLPKITFVALWDMVLLRLLLPFSLPSEFSIYSIAAGLISAKAPADSAPAAFPSPISPIRNGNEILAAAPSTPGPAQTFTVDPWMLVWLTGALVCGVFFAAAYLKCRREFRMSLPADHEFAHIWLEEHKLLRPIQLRSSDRISAPLTYGVLRPVILIPKTIDWTDENTLNYVLTHEYVHIRRFDSVMKLALIAAVCIHWFNPMVWLMYILSNRDMELSCDEKVIHLFGNTQKSSYAMALIRMEEQQSRLAPFCNSFSKNAIEERITAIMKNKKRTIPALLAAFGLFISVTTTFATSAVEPAKKQPDSTPVVEWWTAEEYSKWLENEKKELQSMLGEKGWTGGRGEFIWTQEVIDETIAMYEDILEQIKNGYLVSKTVDGSEDTLLMSNASNFYTICDADQISPYEYEGYEEYQPFGISLDKKENALYYKGEKIRYFQDSVEIGDGGVCSRCNYYREDGTVSLRTVRQAEPNPDGSTNPFGPILRLERLSDTEADKLIQQYVIPSATPVTETVVVSKQLSNEEEMLKRYTPFGLTYELDVDPNTGLVMRWKGKTVHSLYDTETGTWFANSLNGLYLGPDAIDLETVYVNGKLTGFREVRSHGEAVQQQAAETTVTNGNETDEGTTLPDLFDKYKPYGITYREIQTADGVQRNLYYNGKLVNQFADINPNGGVFTFGSSEQSEDGLKLHTVYENGKLAGIR